MHAMPAMFGGGIRRDGAVIGFAENRACIGRGGWHRSKDIGCGWLFSERFVAILRGAVDGAVAAVGCAVREATRWGRRSLAKDEEFDEGTD